MSRKLGALALALAILACSMAVKTALSSYSSTTIVAANGPAPPPLPPPPKSPTK